MRPGTATASLPDTVALPDGLRPEGITSGPGTTFYVGSVSDGRIVTGDLLEVGTTRAAARRHRTLAARALPRPGHRAGLGGRQASAPRRTSGRSTTPPGRSWKTSLVPGGAFLNDLVVTERRRVGHRLPGRPAHADRPEPSRPPDATPLRPSCSSPASGRPSTADTDANGIRELPDGSLVLNNSTAGGLWRVNPRTGVTREIEVRGGPGLVGGDGLVLRGRTLYDVRGSGPNRGVGAPAVAAPWPLGRDLARRAHRRDARRALDGDLGRGVALGGQRPLRRRLARRCLLLGHPARRPAEHRSIPPRAASALDRPSRTAGRHTDQRGPASGRAEDARRAARRTRRRSVRPRRRGCCGRC